MIPQNIKQRLLDNWGEPANSLNCFAEIKFIDEISLWECYIYAMDSDEDSIKCLIIFPNCEAIFENWSLKKLYLCYNQDGNAPIVDKEYRKIKISELYKKFLKPKGM